MNVAIIVLIFILAFFLIVKGADMLVESGIFLAEVTHIPPMIIGATIISISTSLPEIFISVIATVRGQTTFAVANVFDSMICNFALVLGFSCLVMPSVISRKQFAKKSLFLFLCLGVSFIFSLDLFISIFEGVFLIALYILYMIINLKDSKKTSVTTITGTKREQVFPMVIQLLVGAFAIGFGASQLVDKMDEICSILNLNEKVVTLTFIAVGTNLPEFVTTITSIKRKSVGLGVGNILGSSILNATFLLGLCSVVSGSLVFDKTTLCVSLPVLAVVVSVMCLPTIITAKTKRVQGFLVLAVYILYAVILLVN